MSLDATCRPGTRPSLVFRPILREHTDSLQPRSTRVSPRHNKANCRFKTPVFLESFLSSGRATGKSRHQTLGTPPPSSSSLPRERELRSFLFPEHTVESPG